MRKLFALLAVVSVFTFGYTNSVYATPHLEGNEQSATGAGDDEGAEKTPEEIEAAAAAAAKLKKQQAAAAKKQAMQNKLQTQGSPEGEPKVNKNSVHQTLKDKIIEGDVFFMSFVIVCLILGLAFAIERIVYLSLASTDTDRLLADVENALNSGGVESAKEVCRNTKGPVASIFYQGLDRADEGLDMAEKSVIAYGSVQMGLLEKGLSWIQLFIALAPMLGFMGTVIGMIDAFDKIQASNSIEPAMVAGGIKMALITTVAGLIVAIILQVFYNIIVSKVDSIVNQMEDSSIGLIDLLAKQATPKA